MGRNWLFGFSGVVVVLLAGLYFAQGSRAPVGQPALVEMNNQTLSELQAEFNKTANAVRIILLLSPT